ncbi:DivIVA domain-containing protein [Frigoribacterium sp. CG_9.8]|nr:DivIVA domain-containing protein [Frigoribacterium sp. CG_9.8]MBG6107878.1 DivIVA domain-containing protein [Frigoribacterium sp. CG_9.8]
MALTPEDVVNKRFQPTKFREGYDQDEVDDFLDEIVVELRRLTQENEELRQRIIAGESRISELQRSAAQQTASTEQSQLPARDSTLFGEAPVAAPLPAPLPVPMPALVATSAADQDAYDTGSTNNLLQLARKLHEEHVREGIEKRDALIAEGHATAARVVSEAEEAERVQSSRLDSERAGIEQQIESLRSFEREYRQKLKGYIEAQLTELDATESTSATTHTPVPGSGNSGSANSGSANSGSGKSGLGKSGSANSGSANSGSANSAPSAMVESVPVSGAPYDLGSSDGTPVPPPASFRGFAGN